MRSEEEVNLMLNRLGERMKDLMVDDKNNEFSSHFDRVVLLNWVLGRAPDDAVIEDLCHSPLNILQS